MSFKTIPISSSQVFNLSASYRYDDKIDLNPILYDYDNGFSLFHHNLFNGVKDVKFAQHSFFALTSSVLFDSVMNDTVYLNSTDLVIYTTFLASNNRYVTNDNGTLYADIDSTVQAAGPNEFFRVTKNDDSTFSILQNNLYATVITDRNQFSIQMLPKLPIDPLRLQKFDFYNANIPSHFTIRGLFEIPEWKTYFSKVERFWSYYDGPNSWKPSYKGTRPNMIKTIGALKNFDYEPENKYLFTTESDLDCFAIGFDGKIKWVKYHNDFFNKFYNKNTTLKDVITDITPNLLVEYPYRTEITNLANKTGDMGLNLITLKNTMTPEYNYAVK